MKIPRHFFAEHSWPTPERLVELAKSHHGFVRDEASSGVWYSSDQDEWEKAQTNVIPEGMVRVAWLGLYENERDTEVIISEAEYLQALHVHLSSIPGSHLAEQVAALLHSS